MITYKKKSYPTRTIGVDFSGIKVNVEVAQQSLWNVIQNDVEVGQKEATAIDDHIMYYCNAEEWEMNDRQLTNLLYSL